MRFWSASGDLDPAVIEALRSRRFDRVPVVTPSVDELAAQLREELAVSRRHLGAMLDSYWDRDWRRQHSGHEESPEDHLWRAATAVTDIWAALDGLQG